jgi:aminoglycoside phosphotransferase (APT) family kinase protein
MPPAPHGVRLEWADVPARVRAATDAVLGTAICTATNIAGGFSPGPAARCELRDGRTVFVKAVGAELNARSLAMHRREATIAAALPADYPSPRLLHHVDVDDWTVLVFEHCAGRMPAQPWRADDLATVLELLTVMSRYGTPCPIEWLEREGESLGGDVARWNWRALDDEPALVDRLDPWSRRHLARLAALEDGWIAASAGDSLLHHDVRADNVLLRDGAPAPALVVDWPSARAGAAWVDLLGFLPSAVMQGAGDAELIFRAHPLGRAADPDRVTTSLAALAGYFVRTALLPAPPGLPTVRPFQAAQGVVAIDWLAQRTGWR